MSSKNCVSVKVQNGEHFSTCFRKTKWLFCRRAKDKRMSAVWSGAQSFVEAIRWTEQKEGTKDRFFFFDVVFFFYFNKGREDRYRKLRSHSWATAPSIGCQQTPQLHHPGLYKTLLYRRKEKEAEKGDSGMERLERSACKRLEMKMWRKGRRRNQSKDDAKNEEGERNGNGNVFFFFLN